MLRSLLILLLVLVGLYAVFSLYLYTIQHRLLYYPTKPLRTHPEEAGLAYEAAEFETSDGETLYGWWIPADAPRGVLLFCHGNAGNIAGRLDSIRRFHRLGLSVFIYDYRGYGHSSGKPSEKGLYRDGEAAWRYLTERRGISPSEIVVFGRSLGSAIAVRLAADHAPAAAVLESPFTSIPDVANAHYPYLPTGLLTRIRFNNLKRIQHVQSPVLILHSPTDEIIPYELGRRLYEAAPDPKTFVQLDGGHNDAMFATGQRYLDALDAFLSEHGV